MLVLRWNQRAHYGFGADPKGHMEKQEIEVEWKLETENGNRNWKWKWKCANRWRAVLRICKVGIAQDTAYRVEMVLCAAMEEGPKGFVVTTCVLL